MASGEARGAAITEILRQLEHQDGAFDALVPAVYDTLRRLARQQLRRHRAGGLDTTELVHEAYLKLAAADPRWQNRRHFFATAAKVMRHLLTDAARRARAAKRGGDVPHHPQLEADAAADGTAVLAREAEAVLALDDALRHLAGHLPRLASVVELRFFGGLTEEEAAEVLACSPRTVRRDWVRARAWLHDRLTDRPRAEDRAGEEGEEADQAPGPGSPAER